MKSIFTLLLLLSTVLSAAARHNSGLERQPDGTLNGDETHQGRHVRIGVDDFKILHVTLYPY